MFVVVMLSAIASYASQMLAFATIAIIVTLTFRHDLAAKVIARYSAADDVDEASVVDDGDVSSWPVLDDGDAGSWVATVQELTGVRVPAAVALQVLVNRVLEFQAERLMPLDRHLERTGKLLSAAKQAQREAWTAQRY